MTGADVVTEARSWIGTPFHWQASLKGVGCDCKGLVWGVARELGLPEAASIHAAVADYGDVVPVERLKRGMAATFQRVSEPKPGDVLLVKAGGKPQHLGIFTGPDVIHCWGRGHRGVLQCVVAHPARIALRAWPVDSVWRFGSLNNG